jgi:hypothetical protein
MHSELHKKILYFLKIQFCPQQLDLILVHCVRIPFCGVPVLHGEQNTLELLHVLTFANVTIMRNFEVVRDKYNVMEIGSRGDYAH